MLGILEQLKDVKVRSAECYIYIDESISKRKRDLRTQVRVPSMLKMRKSSPL